MDKLQVDIINDYSGSMLSSNGKDVFYAMISFRENVIHPLLEDVIEQKFQTQLKIHYLANDKDKTFNKQGDPIFKDNPKFKDVTKCKGLANIVSKLDDIYSRITTKTLVIVLSDSIWMATPSEVKEICNKYGDNSDAMVLIINLNQRVPLSDNVLFSNIDVPHINLTDSGYEDTFEEHINTFLKI